MRYEWIDQNPIELVRQSAKREKVPDVLELAEPNCFSSSSIVRGRTLVLLDAATGLLVSELRRYAGAMLTSRTSTSESPGPSGAGS